MTWWYHFILPNTQKWQDTQYVLRLGMRWKTMEFQMNSITNSVAAKQVNVRIINEFFDSSPKWWEPNEPLGKFGTLRTFAFWGSGTVYWTLQAHESWYIRERYCISCAVQVFQLITFTTYKTNRSRSKQRRRKWAPTTTMTGRPSLSTPPR
jgi:hypothetical protein